MIAEQLAGKRIAITGATGFLGTALVERLARSVPDCELVLLIRAGRRRTVEQRLQREILRNDCFDRLRNELGDRFDDEMSRRFTAIAGDVGTDGLGLSEADRGTLASCDIVIHSAATVAFDSPLDSAVEVNLLGPTRLAATLHSLGIAPHLVSVSTCYVAGSRRGGAAEQILTDTPWLPEVDWRAEVTGARRARDDAEAESRTPESLTRFAAEAKDELGAAGTPALAARTEKFRQGWVSERMVEIGRARAGSLGWPDAYAFTKALGEIALDETRRNLPVTIVRPAIIESSLAEPVPGWIRGFRMAEPVILSYARGLLKEFPGIPEGTVDVIPVDLVVNAIIGAAARGPLAVADGESTSRPSAETKPPIDVIQVASGSANPLRYRRLVDLVQTWFGENPLYDRKGQPILVPEWSFPGRGRVQRQLTRAVDGLARAESVINALPIRGKRAEFAARIEERRSEAERALSYVELYGAYAECEAIYDVSNLLTLHRALDPADQDAFGMDPAIIDWDRYVQDIHLPSVVTHARVRTTAGTKDGPTRSQRLRKQVLEERRQLAVFDLENTLIASNVVDSYAWLASRRLGSRDKAKFVAKTLAEAPSLLALDRQDRGDFLRHFYRRYEGAPKAQLDRDVEELFSALFLTKSFPEGIRRVREHRRLGHRTLLITGALDVVIAPIAPLFDDVVCASLRVENGLLTGELVDVPPTGESRAQVMADYCTKHDLDIAETVAYADSTSDLPMLEAAGFPVAVNPETRLAALARKRGWLIEHWEKTAGGPRPLLPLAARSKSPHLAARIPVPR